MGDSGPPAPASDDIGRCLTDRLTVCDKNPFYSLQKCLTCLRKNEFRSVLDEAVILAILGDFDLTREFDEARSILETISSDVATEEASGFTSNALSADADGSPMGAADDPSSPEWHASSTSASVSRGLEDTSITDFSDTLSDRFEALELSRDVSIASLDDEGKIAELKLIFPTLRPYDISHTLKKVEGDFTRACEELLNTQYLEENGLRARGIEGAYRPDEWVGYKKGRSEQSADRPGKARLEIAYQLKPLDLSEDDAPSITSPTSSSHRATNGYNLPSRPVSISRDIVSAPNSPATKPIGWQTVSSKQSQRKTYSELTADAANAYETTASSFAAAQRAWRRGKSDAHYRPVAGVYAERAREQLEAYRAVEVRKYEALVNEQSSAGHIDLHGVPVADGVRIALEKTSNWWADLGDNRTKKAREKGFVVVTGLGKHSAGGVSRLRQEVGAALKREGWRVTVETGQFVVTGRA